MLLPTSHTVALLLLFLAPLCLGSWPNLLLAEGTRRRFELFYFDFAAGALALALLAALTLGSLGPDLSYSDRIAVAGLRSQVLEIGAGFIFSVGNMLLAAAVSLIGMAFSFPLALSVALLVSAALGFAGASVPALIAGELLLAGAAISAFLATRFKSAQNSAAVRQRSKPVEIRTAARGSIAALMGGVLIGLSAPLAQSSLWGDLGLWPYSGLLMFSVGLFLSTLIFNPFFMNIGLEGGRVTFRNYFARKPGRHLRAMGSGALWALGMLASLLAQSVPAPEQPGQGLVTSMTHASVLVAMAWGVWFWKELAGGRERARKPLVVSAALFAGALILLAFRFPG